MASKSPKKERKKKIVYSSDFFDYTHKETIYVNPWSRECVYETLICSRQRSKLCKGLIKHTFASGERELVVEHVEVCQRINQKQRELTRKRETAAMVETILDQICGKLREKILKNVSIMP